MLNIPEINHDAPVFIYGFGLAGRWSSLQLPGNILGFIDTDAKKAGRTFNGHQVYTVNEASQLANDNTQILITAVDINDVLPALRKIPHKSWFALGKYLDNTTVEPGHFEESTQFVEYALKAVEECHKGYLDTSRLFLRSVDLVITEKCSLKCKDCSNLMQYYEAPVDLPYDEVTADFDALIQGVDHIHEVRLIGGEPFMNKEIYKIIEYVVASPKISQLVVYTNGMIPIKKEFAHILTNPKVVFTITDYGDLAKNTLRVAASLEEIGVAFRLHPPENWTDSGVIEDFDRGLEENKTLFAECCGKNLYTVSAGKFYRCPFAANADRLQAIPDDPLNSVPVTAGQAAIRHYATQIDYLPACNYCKGRSFGAPEIEPAIQTKTPLKYKKFTLSVA